MEIFNKELILLDVDANDKNSILKIIADKMYSLGILSDKNKFLKDVIFREEFMSTYVGRGISIPHAKSTGVLKSAVCLARLKEDNEIVWNENSYDNVRIVIMIAVEDGADDIHLKIISKLARNLMHDEFVNNILNSDLETLYKILNNLNI